MKKLLLAFVLANFGLPTPFVLARTIALENQKSEVNFLAIGKPGFLKIKGSGGRVTGGINLKDTSPKMTMLEGIAEVEMKDFVTGMSLRDKHMKNKYLEIKQFPLATLTFKSEIPVELKAYSESFSREFELKGTMNLHGVTKPIAIKFRLEKNASALSYSANFELNLADYSIDIPSFLGVTVAKTVNVNIEGSAIISKEMSAKK